MSPYHLAIEVSYDEEVVKDKPEIEKELQDTGCRNDSDFIKLPEAIADLANGIVDFTLTDLSGGYCIVALNMGPIVSKTSAKNQDVYRP